MKTEQSGSESYELRITALWALSESALGGILHLFKVPFSGIILSGAAVIFICLLAGFHKNSTVILKATTIVILIKFTMAPHSPLTAYFSVFTQGLFGTVLFTLFNSSKINALILGIIAVTFSGFQRLIVITLIFGNTFWNSLDEFAYRIVSTFVKIESSEMMSLSLIVVTIYLLIHLTAGIFIGIVGYKIPQWISKFSADYSYNDIVLSEVIEKHKNKKKWYNKKIVKTIVFFIAVAALVSILFPVENSGLLVNVLYMSLRAVVIVIIWIFFVAPFIKKILSKILKRKQKVYGQKLEQILEILPLLKHIVTYSWRDTKEYTKITRIKEFLLRVITITLTIDLN